MCEIRLTIDSSDHGAVSSVCVGRVDDWDKSASLFVGEASRRSASSLEATSMSAHFLGPLQGRTQLWSVVLIYGLGVNCVLCLAALPFQPLQATSLWVFLGIGLVVGLYQLIALWQCAYNSRFRSLGSVVRACVAVSFLAVPLFTYILVTQYRAQASNRRFERPPVVSSSLGQRGSR